MSGFRLLEKSVRNNYQRIHQYGCSLFDTAHRNAEVFVPSTLVLLLVGIILASEQIKEQVREHQLALPPLTVVAQAPYPLLAQSQLSDVSAKAFVVMDDDSKVIMLARNATHRLAMASTTKIMTALVALDYYQRDDILTIQDDKDAIEGVRVGFSKGERLRFESLLYALLVPSGNDAAVAIAKNFSGGEGAFVRKMNEKAFTLRLFDSNYSDPSGLTDEGNFTTALDLARLASVALRNETIATIVATRSKVIKTVDGKKAYRLENLNKLLGTNGVRGIKTGFTDGAQGVLVTSRVENGKTLIVVVMRSKDRFVDTQKILEYLAKNVTYVSTNP